MAYKWQILLSDYDKEHLINLINSNYRRPLANLKRSVARATRIDEGIVVTDSVVEVLEDIRLKMAELSQGPPEPDRREKAVELVLLALEAVGGGTNTLINDIIKIFLLIPTEHATLVREELAYILEDEPDRPPVPEFRGWLWMPPVMTLLMEDSRDDS